MTKNKKMAKFLIQLFLWIFLIGSLQPTPLYAAEAIQTQVKAAAATDEPSLLDQAIQFFTPEDPQLQPKEKEDSGFWDSVGNFLGLNDPAEEKGEALATEMLPHKEQAPKGKKMPQPKRVKELTQKRTANAKFYELADGRQQVEISSDPIHYKDDKGNWKKIDTRIQSTNQSGFNMKNDKNTFQSFFGKKSDQLVRFQLGKRHLTLGVQETKKQTLTPNREDNVVTYPEVWEHADLKYTVLPKSLKEEIVLKKAPQDPTYRFSLKLGGVEAKERKDGSIAFVAKGTGQVMFVISKPFMIDSKDDPESPYGKVYSDQVTQSVEQKGAHITVTVKADPKWLASEKRQYPVTIDPTITLQPTPATSRMPIL